MLFSSVGLCWFQWGKCAAHLDTKLSLHKVCQYFLKMFLYHLSAVRASKHQPAYALTSATSEVNYAAVLLSIREDLLQQFVFISSETHTDQISDFIFGILPLNVTKAFTQGSINDMK